MENPPIGTTPLETAVENVEVLKAKLLLAESERDTAKAEALRANRAVEAGKKFEKFEEFQSAVLGDITSLKTELGSKTQEIEDLKKIISTNAAVTPNYSTVPQTPEEIKKASDAENGVRNMFGLPVKK